ncbi:hypothetical protein HPB49_011426 [Dermacentor silvarum]|uniref:Uncharacterized protein n=1 Tax=Dermacentor silvarum TaxID=543639 RepID=A0ACB8C386_DERSI|nr:hypothetical protein HPB49_011426 [Dermacentor silvarum]
MQQDDNEESQESTAAGEWITAASKAQRRRGRRKLNLTCGQPPPFLPLERQLRLTMRKPAPRPAPLPLDDHKLVMRPRTGLDVAKLPPSELSLALLQATNTTWRQANLQLRIDQNQNTATVSTPTKEIAMKLIEVSKIKLGETEHSVEMYGLAPDDTVKGVIHSVPTRLTIQEIKEKIMEDGFEIYTVRRMGKDSTAVILTFAGPVVPHYLWLYGAEYRCTLHKKTVPVCWVRPDPEHWTERPVGNARRCEKHIQIHYKGPKQYKEEKTVIERQDPDTGGEQRGQTEQHNFTLLNQPDTPNRMDTSTTRDTTPDLSLLMGTLDASWQNVVTNLGSDHDVIRITIRGPTLKVKTGTANITN